MTEEYVCHGGIANGNYSPCSSCRPSGKTTVDPLPLVITELGGNFVLVSNGSIVPIKVAMILCVAAVVKRKKYEASWVFSPS